MAEGHLHRRQRGFAMRGAVRRVRQAVRECAYQTVVHLSPRKKAAHAPRSAAEYDRLVEEYGIAPGQRVYIRKDGVKYRLWITRVTPHRIEYNIDGHDRSNWMAHQRLEQLRIDG